MIFLKISFSVIASPYPFCILKIMRPRQTCTPKLYPHMYECVTVCTCARVRLCECVPVDGLLARVEEHRRRWLSQQREKALEAQTDLLTVSAGRHVLRWAAWP